MSATLDALNITKPIIQAGVSNGVDAINQLLDENSKWLEIHEELLIKNRAESDNLYKQWQESTRRDEQFDIELDKIRYFIYSIMEWKDEYGHD